MKLHHEPVLRDRVVESWASPAAQRLVDGTVGRAGHSLSLLAARDDVRLFCVDRDPEAVAASRARLAGFGDRVRVTLGSYADLPDLLPGWENAPPVDGILLDLGVSSPQLDDPERGFSTRSDGPLDLRFDPTRGESAEEWLADAEQPELERILRDWGEVPRPRRVAEAILAARDSGRLGTTRELREAVEPVARRGREGSAKALARVFQAIRIRVNDELGELERFLASLRGLVAIGGRIAILSFHSLEDRLVKRAFRDAARDCVCPPEAPICSCGGGQAWLRPLERRPVTASEAEIAANPRARSAKLRAAERVATREEAAAAAPAESAGGDVAP